MERSGHLRYCTARRHSPNRQWGSDLPQATHQGPDHRARLSLPTHGLAGPPELSVIGGNL